MALNEGRYTVNYKVLEKKQKYADFHLKDTSEAKLAPQPIPYCMQKNV